MSENNVELCAKYISLIYRKSGEPIKKLLKSIGLTSTQSILIIGIHRNSGINQKDLSNTLYIDTGAISKNLRILEDRNLIYRIVDESNRRNFKLYLTEDGKELLEKNEGLQMEFWEKSLEIFDQNELEQFKSFLERLEDNIG
ncbi:DNA-binding transcriptional regulator, MarR family [Dethiosulfatibacter aminovorans DSM 17477]|uniref:DNA-binding transcriptional regulator, MarR family n=1 Tax=Dethiosulfatibacter aminovorans DSM 17477 TaxID=1121476 RepID=A0A1M6EDM3_9FIRM|nr:MarR family transcriptional regulator [Dethiosulfatibacter aminovorans]SHI83607.1 DNA-binding transcriptional regulator, MarR family [Dethiosulfatibacter aminovorans DSM 17477]